MKFNLIGKFFLSLAFISQTSYADIAGEWYKDCTEISQAGATSYVTSYYTFNADGTFAVEEGAYQDKACNKLFLLITMEGSYAADDQGNLDLVLAKQYLTFSSLLSPLMPVLNLGGFCGYNNWKADVAKDVTGRSCNLMGQDIPTIAGGEENFTIYQVMNGELFLGMPDADHDGSTADNRPVEFDETAYMSLAE